MNTWGIRRYGYIVFYILLVVVLYATMNGNIEENILRNDTSEASIASGQESEYDIFIDLTESMLYLFKGDELIKKYAVAQGKDKSPSPIGIWEITSKARNWGTGFGTRWMGINVPWGIYGIHGTNKPYSIGQRASAGCFRMHNSDVEELYDIVPYRTKVYVYGGPYKNLGSHLEVLSPGDRKSHVLEVQLRLKTKGYYKGAIDGIYGEGMKQALLEFKKDNGLPNNHYVDRESYEALGILQFE
ncbi:MAG: L,D-transpeptidase family protein [Clostridiales bacterium]|jgi:hypothetical protein|nr:L,D-transpeptidase family protein [Clostridiales bacterium]